MPLPYYYQRRRQQQPLGKTTSRLHISTSHVEALPTSTNRSSNSRKLPFLIRLRPKHSSQRMCEQVPSHGTTESSRAGIPVAVHSNGHQDSLVHQAPPPPYTPYTSPPHRIPIPMFHRHKHGTALSLQKYRILKRDARRDKGGTPCRHQERTILGLVHGQSPLRCTIRSISISSCDQDTLESNDDDADESNSLEVAYDSDETEDGDDDYYFADVDSNTYSNPSCQVIRGLSNTLPLQTNQSVSVTISIDASDNYDVDQKRFRGGVLGKMFWNWKSGTHGHGRVIAGVSEQTLDGLSSSHLSHTNAHIHDSEEDEYAPAAKHNHQHVNLHDTETETTGGFMSMFSTGITKLLHWVAFTNANGSNEIKDQDKLRFQT